MKSVNHFQHVLLIFLFLNYPCDLAQIVQLLRDRSRRHLNRKSPRDSGATGQKSSVKPASQIQERSRKIKTTKKKSSLRTNRGYVNCSERALPPRPPGLAACRQARRLARAHNAPCPSCACAAPGWGRGERSAEGVLPPAAASLLLLGPPSYAHSSSPVRSLGTFLLFIHSYTPHDPRLKSYRASVFFLIQSKY